MPSVVLPSTSTTGTAAESRDPIDSFEVIEIMDTLKLSVEEKFVAKVNDYNVAHKRYLNDLSTCEHYFGKIRRGLDAYVKDLRRFLEELARQTEREWLMEPEFTDLIEPQFFIQYQFLAQLYSPVAERDSKMAEQLLKVRQLFFQQALLERMDISRMTTGRLEFRDKSGRLRKPSSCDVSQILADGLDIVKNLLITTTDKLYNELHDEPEVQTAGSDPARPLIVFNDHVRRWERFLRARHNWWQLLKEDKFKLFGHLDEVAQVAKEHSDIDAQFERFFRAFHTFADETENLCLERGNIRTLCHILDEWALENMRSTVFSEIAHSSTGVDPLSEQLKIVEKDLQNHELIFNRLKRMIRAMADRQTDSRSFTREERQLIRGAYLRYLKLDLVTKRFRSILDARQANKVASSTEMFRWLNWACADSLELEAMPPIETLEVEFYIRSKADRDASNYRSMYKKMFAHDQELQQCMSQLNHAAELFSAG